MFVDVQTRESDMDRQGHVNSLSMGFLFREGWTALQHHLFDAAGSIPGRRFLVVRITLDFIREVEYPGTVQIGVGVLALGRSSLTLGCGLFQRGVGAAVSDYTVVHANPEGPLPLPQDVRDRAASFLLPGAD